MRRAWTWTCSCLVVRLKVELWTCWIRVRHCTLDSIYTQATGLVLYFTALHVLIFTTVNHSLERSDERPTLSQTGCLSPLRRQDGVEKFYVVSPAVPNGAGYDGPPL